MNQKGIVVTESDLQRLQHLLREQIEVADRDQAHLHDLEEELGRARIVDEADLPAGVVTMNAQVRVQDVETGDSRAYALVFPHEADLSRGRLSVLAPLGTALLGYRAGDEVEWRMPGGVRRLRIDEVVRAPAQQANAQCDAGCSAGA